MQYILNENYTDVPIKPTDFPGESKPEHQKYFSTVREISKDITKWASDATGGKGSRGGGIDISPEALDHFYDTYSGGLGKTIGNTVETIFNLVNGKKTDVRNVPFLRKFRGRIVEGIESADFYDIHKELLPYAKDEKMIKRSGTPKDKMKLRVALYAKATAKNMKGIGEKYNKLPDTEKNRIKEKIEKDKEAKRFKRLYRRYLGEFY